jgi:hypothetical protein
MTRSEFSPAILVNAAGLPRRLTRIRHEAPAVATQRNATQGIAAAARAIQRKRRAIVFIAIGFLEQVACRPNLDRKAPAFLDCLTCLFRFSVASGACLCRQPV